jgi:hypothetical protein
MTMTDDERMQRESSLIATIRKKLPEFAQFWARAVRRAPNDSMRLGAFVLHGGVS